MKNPLRGFLWAGAAVAVPATVNAVIAARAGHFEQPLPGDIAYYDWTHGRVAFYRLGLGPPLLLVHNPNICASSWEWRKIFPELANQFTVYSLDLLGYGLSDKPDMAYSGALYAQLVHDFLEDVIGRRAHAIGSGLSASYLVNVAVRRPELLENMVLVNPTGTTSTKPPVVENLTTLALRSPIFGTSIYYTLVSRRNLETLLRSYIYYDAGMVTPDVIDALYTAGHQPGSQYAAAAYLSGQLDLPMRMAFADLDRPVMLIWGRDAYFTPVIEATDLLYRHPESRLEIIDECGMLPHDEKAGEFIRIAGDFLSAPSLGDMAA